MLAVDFGERPDTAGIATLADSIWYPGVVIGAAVARGKNKVAVTTALSTWVRISAAPSNLEAVAEGIVVA